MHLTQVLSIAHRPPMERKNMSGGAPLTHKICLTDGAHPGLNGPAHFFLMRDVALWVRKSLRTVQKGALLHFEEEPPYFISRARARTIDMSGTTFLSYQLPATKKQSTIQQIGIKVETVATKIKRN